MLPVMGYAQHVNHVFKPVWRLLAHPVDSQRIKCRDIVLDDGGFPKQQDSLRPKNAKGVKRNAFHSTSVWPCNSCHSVEVRRASGKFW